MNVKYEHMIVNKLLDKYENSKTFTGNNKVNQKFSVKISSLFPKYIDHSNYEIFQAVNDAIDILARKRFITAKANSAKVYKEAVLEVNMLDPIYSYVNRVPKKDTNVSIMKLMEAYRGKNDILKLYCETQIERIRANKAVQYYSDDLIELENTMIAVDELLKVETETFIRDFSIRVFKDSKIFESISSKVVSLLYEYGEFPEKEQVLNNLNIIKNPTYVNFKGAGVLSINSQRLDLTGLSSDIAISSMMLPDIDEIKITGHSVITIENLTSFHTFKNKDMFVIYLGGYHNSVRREFMKKIYNQNPEKRYLHFGDIDAGGFYILEHLKKEIGISFKPYKMDVETLKEYQQYSKKLTETDRNRLIKLHSSYPDIISHMLDNNCKLEQEAIITCDRWDKGTGPLSRGMMWARRQQWDKGTGPLSRG